MQSRNERAHFGLYLPPFLSNAGYATLHAMTFLLYTPLQHLPIQVLLCSAPSWTLPRSSRLRDPPALLFVDYFESSTRWLNLHTVVGEVEVGANAWLTRMTTTHSIGWLELEVGRRGM
jgi:hypothetical protein